MADVAIVASAVANAPQDYKLPGAQEILLRAVGCQINGANAAGTFLPALQMIDPAGHVMWTAVNRSLPVAAGASALMSWFPGGGLSSGSSSTSTGGITSITSPNATLSVTSPSGPSTALDIPNSGVTAGTYGDATHTSQVTVNVEGIVTAASQVSISGIAGTGLVKLFDSTLGVAAASIDTGASAIPTGHGDLIVVLLLETSQAVAISTASIQVNGDTAAHYDTANWTINTGTTTSGRTAAGSSWAFFCAGTGNMYPTVSTLTIPAYDAATLQKIGHLIDSCVDNNGAAGWLIEQRSCGWRSTAAINQIKVTAGSGNLVAGSRMAIYGTQ